MRGTRVHNAGQLGPDNVEVPRQDNQGGGGIVKGGVQPQDHLEQVLLSSPDDLAACVCPHQLQDIAPPQGTCLGNWQRLLIGVLEPTRGDRGTVGGHCDEGVKVGRQKNVGKEDGLRKRSELLHGIFMLEGGSPLGP